MKKATYFYLLRRGFLGGGGAGDSFTGLLDSYSGAAAAYSLRQLSSTYTGNAITVRRASDNTTQNIGFVNNELDTASLETFCSGTDGFVTTWYDQSGNGLNATQTTAGEQPQIVDNGSTKTHFGKPSIEFSSIRNTSISSNSFTLINQPLTHFAIFKGVGTNDFVTSGLNASNRNIIWEQPTVYRIYAGATLDSTYSYDSDGVSFYGLFNGASSELSINGGSADTGNAGTQGLSQIYIGGDFDGSNDLDGFISEYIVYGSNESSNKSGIETNINDFYSIY